MGIIQPTIFQRVAVTQGGASLAPFFPLSLPNLEEYYDARTPALTVANGGNVNPWVDLSGHSPTRDETPYNPGVSDNPPVLRKLPSTLVSPKGLPLVDYNGVDQSGASGTINPMPNPNTRGLSAHAFANWILQGVGVVWQDDTGQRPQLLLTSSLGTVGWRDTSGTRAIAGALDGFHLYSWVFDKASGICTVYMDGVALGTNAWTIAYLNPASTISAVNQVGNAHLQHRRGFFAWYSDSHSAATVAQFQTWRRVFWG